MEPSEAPPPSSPQSSSVPLTFARAELPGASPSPDDDAPRWPLALPAGLVLSAVSLVIYLLRMRMLFARGTYDRELSEVLARWSALHSSLHLAGLALSLAGALELVRRTRGRAQLGARAAAGALALLCVLLVAQRYLDRARGLSEDELEAVMSWMNVGRSLGWLTFSAGVLLAGWHKPRVRVLAAPVLIFSLLSAPLHFFGEPLFRFLHGVFGDSPWVWTGFVSASTVLHSASLLTALWLGTPLAELGGGWERVARSLDRAGIALYARLCITAAGAALLLLAAGSPDSSALGKLWWLAVPAGVVVANAVLVSFLLGVGGLNAPGAPRRTLYLAAALITTAFALSALQTYELFRGVRDLDEPLLPLGLPLLAALGQATLASGLAAIAKLLPSLAAQDQALSSRTTVIACQVLTMGVLYVMKESPPESAAGAIGWLALTSIFGIVALVSQAHLCRTLAQEINFHTPVTTDLPAATVLQK